MSLGSMVGGALANFYSWIFVQRERRSAVDGQALAEGPGQRHPARLRVRARETPI